MEKMYRVVIHYEGAVDFEVEAENITEAEMIAERHFDDMDDRELCANLCEVGICDCYEVN